MDIFFEGFVKKIFESDSGLGKKIIGGIVVGISFGIGITWKMNSGNPPDEQIGLGGAIAATLILTIIVTGLVCLFYYRDVVKTKISNGQSVNFVSRLIFGGGISSILLWTFIICPFLFVVVTVIFTSFL